MDGYGYGQYCPVALGAEVFAERWTPIILRNLLIGCERFGEILDGAPGLPRSVLSQRLRRLESTGIVHRGGAGYQLTVAGRELAEVALTLGVWAARWREPVPEQLDPYLMLWAVSRLIDPATLDRPRIVVRFDVTDRAAPDRFWLVAGRRNREICVSSPGWPEDGIVVTDASSLFHWHMGRMSLASSVTGPPWLERTLADWGRLSPFSGIQPVAAG